MNSPEQIAGTSRRYKILLTIIFYCIPVLYALAWGFVEYFPNYWSDIHSVEIVGGFTPLMQFLAYWVSMLKGAVVMSGIWVLIKLFELYEKGVFFKAENVACFKKLSRILIWWVVAGIVVTPLTALILTMNNPPGEHVLQISFQSADLTALIIGGVLRVIAGVMEDGRRLQEEIELTV